MPVKASPNLQAKLLDLQAIDTKLNQLDHRAKMLPELERLAVLSAENTALRVELLGAAGARDDARLELARIESDVSVVEARIARDNARLQASTSVKDVAGLESELAGLHRRQLELEEIELTVMERLEALETTARSLEQTAGELAARVAEVSAERDLAAGQVALERSEVASGRSAITAALPEDLLALYERLRARYGIGATLLRGGTSVASGVKFHESDMQAIRATAPDEIVICPDSSAILVRTAESGL